MIREDLREKRLFFDGGMGTLLQEKGLKAGELPEIWNLEHSEEVISIHQAYIEAGSDIMTKYIRSQCAEIPRWRVFFGRNHQDCCRTRKRSGAAERGRQECIRGAGCGTDRKAFKANGRPCV